LFEWAASRFGYGEIVVPALTASIVPNVVHASGHRVRFVDVDPTRHTAGADALLSAVTPDTRAVVSTHLEGFPVDSVKLCAALAGRDILVIEDAAHTVGATVGAYPVGGIADAAVFSLGKGKQVNAMDGGVVTCRDAELHDWLRQRVGNCAFPSAVSVLRKMVVVGAMDLLTQRHLFDATLWPGIRLAAKLNKDPLYSRFEDALDPPSPDGPPAIHRRLGPAQAALGNASLAAQTQAAERRRSLWRRYGEAAAHGGLAPQQRTPGTEPVPLEFAIEVADVERARQFLRDRGIDSQPTWMVGPARLPAFSDCAADFPRANHLAEHLLYLPFYPSLTDSEVERVASILQSGAVELQP
jgi:dTDP-4-amino-4,6-dideoxygalactose transaminase